MKARAADMSVMGKNPAEIAVARAYIEADRT
jgi:hypothetical protein